MTRKNKDKKFQPKFSPQYVEVILDEGYRELKGSLVRLQIKDIQYATNYMRIYVKDYRS